MGCAGSRCYLLPGIRWASLSKVAMWSDATNVFFPFEFILGLNGTTRSHDPPKLHLDRIKRGVLVSTFHQPEMSAVPPRFSNPSMPSTHYGNQRFIPPCISTILMQSRRQNCPAESSRPGSLIVAPIMSKFVFIHDSRITVSTRLS